MGFSTLLDILGAMFIGGILLLSLQTVNQNVITNYFYYKSDVVLQGNLISIVEILEIDMKRIGYTQNPALIPTNISAILEADTSNIRFRGDVDNNGTVDTVRYFLGSVNELSHTRNPRDRMLYRRINSGPAVGSNMGITEFKFKYYDTLGDSLATPLTGVNTGLIATIQVSIKVESSDAINEDYAQAFWRQVRISARNLSNR